MENPIYVAVTRQRAIRREMESVANNLANMNTPAYKAERNMFREFLVSPQKRAPRPVICTGCRSGTGSVQRADPANREPV